jgi:hypothetical protein
MHASRKWLVQKWLPRLALVFSSYFLLFFRLVTISILMETLMVLNQEDAITMDLK